MLNEFPDVLQQYNQELKPFVRIDNELLDLLIVSSIQSLDYILNRDISIFLKPYVFYSVDIIKKYLKNAHYYFDFFYKNLESSMDYKEIIIPMIRYYLFLGLDRRIFTIFMEFHKRKIREDFIILLSYFVSKEDMEFGFYSSFIEKVYSHIITNSMSSDVFLIFLYKKNLNILKERLFYSAIWKEEYNKLKNKVKNEYLKILINNWLFTNLLSSGNIYSAFRFYQCTKKENFLFQKEYIKGLELKLGYILIKHQKFYGLKILKNDEFKFYNQEEFFKKFNFLFVDNSQSYIPLKLLFEYNFYDYYYWVHKFFEDILLIGMEWNSVMNHFTVDTNQIWNYLEKPYLNLNIEKFLYILKENYNKQPTEKEFKEELSEEFYIPLIVYIAYKYRKKILYYSGFDPIFKSLIGIFYEHYNMELSIQLYKSNPHPLVIFRLNGLYKINPLLKKINEKYIKKKMEKIN